MPRARILKTSALLAITLGLLLGWRVFGERDVNAIHVESLGDLERELEGLRARLRIPAMSAAIAENGRLLWSRGFGIAHTERGVPAGDDTIYHLASLTDTLAALSK